MKFHSGANTHFFSYAKQAYYQKYVIFPRFCEILKNPAGVSLFIFSDALGDQAPQHLFCRGY